MWINVFAFVSCPKTRLSLRLACKTACQIVDRTCKTVDLWDKFYYYREVAEDPTCQEMHKLLQKLPHLRNVDMYWHTKRGFCEAAQSIIDVAKTLHKDCRVMHSQVQCGSGTTCIDGTELQSLLELVVSLDNLYIVWADVLVGS